MIKEYKKLNQKQLSDYIISDDTINCVAFLYGASIHQIIGLKVVIHYYESIGIKLKGILVFSSEKSFNKIKCNVNIKYFENVILINDNTFFDSIKNIINCYISNRFKKKKSDFYYITVHGFPYEYAIIKLALNEKIFNYIEIEDGMKIFTEMLLKNKKIFYKSIYGYGFLNYFRILTAKYLKNIAIKQNRYQLISNFEYANNKLVKKQPFNGYYYNELKRIQTDYEKIKIFEDSIILNTQALIENKYLDEQNYIKILDLIFNIIDTNKFKMVVKVHPAEKFIDLYNKYNCEIYSINDYSQEIILANLKKPPKCMISFFSTSIIYSSLMFNIPTISLLQLVFNDIKKAKKEIVYPLIGFLSKICYMPNNYSEVKNIIETLK